MKELDELKIKYQKYNKEFPHGAAKYIWRYETDYKKWQKFLSQFKGKSVLDFGSGPCIALKAGMDLGIDITGIDIDIDPVYKDMRSILGISPIIYDGKQIPELDKKFDIFIFNWSILSDFEINKDGSGYTNGMNNERLLNRISMLKKMCTNDSVWYISPKKHYDQMKNITGCNVVLFSL